MVAEDNAVRISQVVLEDLAGQLQWFASVDCVLVGDVRVLQVLPDNAEPVQCCRSGAVDDVHQSSKCWYTRWCSVWLQNVILLVHDLGDLGKELEVAEVE